MSEFTAELIGTMLLVLLGCSVVANCVLEKTKGNGGGWIVITTGWALGVFVGVTVAAPYSGAHINPAVTLGLAMIGSFPWESVPLFILAQMLGAALGAFIVWLFYQQHFEVTEDHDTKLAVFSTIPAIRNPIKNLISEVVGTFVLVYAVLHVAEPEISTEVGKVSKVGMGSLGAIPVTLIVLGIGLSLGGTTGYAINPARDLGPRIMHSILPISNKGSSDWAYAWVPIVGPLLGAGVAVVLTLLCG
ncbi:MAG: MIP/aquaporin family protein [Chitinophagales bacterium]